MAKKQKVIIEFTADEVKEIQSAARAVWAEYAYDVLVACGESEDRHMNGVSMSRDEVIEIALDAGRTEDQLERDMARARRGKQKTVITDDLLRRFRDADYEQLIELVTPAFPYQRYGM